MRFEEAEAACEKSAELSEQPVVPASRQSGFERR
jgi:hypothetical protein